MGGQDPEQKGSIRGSEGSRTEEESRKASIERKGLIRDPE